MKEFEKLQEGRRQIVDDLYNRYKESVSPSQLLSLPRTYEICHFSPFANVVKLPADVRVTTTNFEEPMRMLPELLSKYWEEKRRSRLQMIPPIPNSSSAVLAGPDPLELATSVFRCRSYSTLGTIVVGMEGQMTHTCMSPGHGLPGSFRHGWSSDDGDCLSFSPEGSRTARLLIGLAGLDANTATALDMDRCGVRFSCSSCPVHNFNKVFMRFGYSWRSAVCSFPEDRVKTY